MRGQFFLWSAKISWLLVSNPQRSQVRRWPSFSNLDIMVDYLMGRIMCPCLYFTDWCRSTFGGNPQ
jgi:hypothetical protein